MGFNNYMYKDVLAPIASRLVLAERQSVLVLNENLNSKIKLSSETKLQLHSKWEFWDRQSSKDSIVLRKKVRAQLLELKKIFNSKQFYFNVECSDAIIDHAFRWLLHFDFPLLVNQIILAKAIIKKHKPLLLVSSDVADIRSRVFTLVAKQENILTLELQYGSCEHDSLEWKFLLANHIAVWGKEFIEIC